MTQAQQDAVTTAQKKFFDAAAAFNTAQQAAYQAAAQTQAAKDALPKAQVQAQAIIQAANDLYTQAMANQNTVFNAGIAATTAMNQAQADLQNAITASLQTGAVEMMPPPVKQF
jgi:hypothetical protein